MPQDTTTNKSARVELILVETDEIRLEKLRYKLATGKTQAEYGRNR